MIRSVVETIRRAFGHRQTIPSVGVPRHRWHVTELAPWSDLTPGEDFGRALRQEATKHHAMVLFEVAAGRVTVHDKGSDWPPIPGAQPFYDHIRFRAEIYRNFIEESLARFGSRADGMFLIDLDDLHAGEPDIPTFAFQKIDGSRRILLPDLDSIILNFYQDGEFVDNLPIAEKARKAIFVGSTTGDLPLTHQHVTDRLNARIDAALFFKPEPNIHFWLPAVVQCDSSATEEAVRELDVAGRRLTWHQQFNYRYIISIDGNGATCSRVGIAMRSNSVLLKYASPHQLYFFKGLEEGRHFVQITHHSDVTIIVDDKARDEKDRAIANHARDFCASNISRIHALRYTALIINGLLDRTGKALIKTGPVKDTCLECAVRFVDGGAAWTDRNGALTSPAGHAVAAVNVYVDGLLRPNHILVKTIDSAGLARRGPLPSSDENRSTDTALHVLTIKLVGRARWLFNLTGEVHHADGTLWPIGKLPSLNHRSQPIIGFRLTASPRRYIVIGRTILHVIRRFVRHLRCKEN